MWFGYDAAVILFWMICVLMWSVLYTPSVKYPVNTDCDVPSLFCLPEVSNGVGSAEDLYMENGFDYYNNEGISH